LLAVIAALTLVACQSQYMTSAKVYLQQNETDNAIKALKKEIETNPTNGEAYFMMAKALYEKQRYSEVNDYLSLAVENNPKLEKSIGKFREEMWRPFFNRGLSQANAGRLDQALKMYNIAKDINPEKPDTYYALGYIFYQKGQIDEAIKNWETAIEKGILANRKNASVLKNLGNSYLAKQDFENSAKYFKDYLQYNPDDVNAILNLAVDYDQISKKCRESGDTLKVKELDKQVQELMKHAAEVDPNNPTVAHDAGITLFRAGRYDLAAPYFEKVVQLQPQDKETLALLGQCYFQTKNLDKAADAYKKILEIDPQDYKAMRNLGIILGQLGKTDEAIEMIKKYEETKKKVEGAASGEKKNQ